MHVLFSEDFDWNVPGRRGVTVAYRAEWTGSVTRACGKAAIAANKAVRVPAPPRRRTAASPDASSGDA